tara:strand:- start:1032 stop:1862 length:831 start_codon:yes stop_codon:yes gene_type:complete
MSSRCLIVLACFLLSGGVLQAKKDLPFEVGERFNYKLTWGFFTVGSGSIEVEPAGSDEFHFALNVATNGFADAIYRVRTSINSWVDKELTHTTLYKKRQQEGRTNRSVVVDFDWTKNEARFSNWDDFYEPISIRPGVFDPLALMFIVRTRESFTVGETFTMPVTDGKESEDAEFTVVKKETIRVPAGSFEAYKILPKLKHVGGVFSKSKKSKMYVWISADEKHLPLKLSSSVIVGSFSVTLQSMESPSDPEYLESIRTDRRKEDHGRRGFSSRRRR